MKNKDIPFILTALCLLAFTAALFYYQSAIFLPLVIAFILAYVLNPLVVMAEKRGMGRTLAIVLVFFLSLALMAAFVAFFAVSIGGELRDVRINLPEYAERLYALIPQQVKVYFGIETPEKVNQHINAALDALRGVSTEMLKEALVFLKKAFASTLSFILALLGYLLTPIYLYYLLKDLPKMKAVLAACRTPSG